jgi:hypothetical protein
MPSPDDVQDIARLSALRDPVTWSRGERAERYREQAAEFRRLAAAEASSSARDELIALAEQYDRIADAHESAIASVIPSSPGDRP